MELYSQAQITHAEAIVRGRVLSLWPQRGLSAPAGLLGHGGQSQQIARMERSRMQGPRLSGRTYLISSSARTSTIGDTSMPSARAVLRLTTVSYFTGACTGRSAGFSPLRMRST